MWIALFFSYSIIISISGLLLTFLSLFIFKNDDVLVEEPKQSHLENNTLQSVMIKNQEDYQHTKYPKLSMLRQIILIDEEPKLDVTLTFEYQIIDETLFCSTFADQFMHKTIIDVIKKFVTNFGTKGIFDQKIALETRIKGALLAKTQDWGIEFISFNLEKIFTVPLS